MRKKIRPHRVHDEPRRDLHIAVERRHFPPLPWLWTIRRGDESLASSDSGFAGAEEAWEAARRELLRWNAARPGIPLVRPRRA